MLVLNGNFVFNNTEEIIEIEQNIHSTSERGRIEKLQKGVLGVSVRNRKLETLQKPGKESRES